jgi:hypothetical protein
VGPVFNGEIVRFVWQSLQYARKSVAEHRLDVLGPVGRVGRFWQFCGGEKSKIAAAGVYGCDKYEVVFLV